MALVDIESELSDQERAVRDAAHRFAEEVMRPAGARLDALPTPEDVIARSSVLWEVFGRFHELGFDALDSADPDLAPIIRVHILVSAVSPQLLATRTKVAGAGKCGGRWPCGNSVMSRVAPAYGWSASRSIPK
jgi:alkylation response protein AidB-like acyl-CoA dehydrogenase